jgi:hypothetical protein
MGNQFFGHRASLPIGAAVLALDTGRPLFTCCAWYDGNMTVITFDEQILVAENALTGRERLRKAQEISSIVAQRFEKHIRFPALKLILDKSVYILKVLLHHCQRLQASLQKPPGREYRC